MGGVELGLRHARFSEQSATISVFALMGGVEVRRKPAASQTPKSLPDQGKPENEG
jgi:hypothetical protein